MPDADTYVKTVVERLRFWDARVYDAQIGPLQSTVGHLYDTIAVARHQREHRIEVYNLQVHFCVVIAQLPSVDSAFVVDDFAARVSEHAYATTKGSPGVGTVEVAIAGLISPLVHQTAARQADALSIYNRAVGIRRAVVVDLSSNWVHVNLPGGGRGQGPAEATNQRIRRLFPLPAEVDAHPGNALGW